MSDLIEGVQPVKCAVDSAPESQASGPAIDWGMAGECWAVVDWFGSLRPWTTRRSIDSAIRAAEAQAPLGMPWPELEARGWRVVPVRVVPR